MASRDEILANFQCTGYCHKFQVSIKVDENSSLTGTNASFVKACSGIDDVGEAFMHLEAANWNLLQALNVVMPQEAQALQGGLPVAADADVAITPPPLQLPQQPEVISVDSSPEAMVLPTPVTAQGPSTSCAPLHALAAASTSAAATSNQPAVMDVHIQVLCGGASDGSSFPLELPGSITVGELRTMLHQLVGINPCNQVIEGFQTTVQDSTIITPALLPESRTLSLSAISPISYDRQNGTQSDDYLLLIHDEANSKDYSLRFPGIKRIREIKSDIYDLTSIPVRHQQWTGWPPNVEDESMLSTVGISKQHHLTVRRVPNRTPKAQKKVMVDHGDENSSGDEFEDATELLDDDDDFLDMMNVSTTNKSQTLIPADVKDELTGVLHFSEEFRNRYGSCVPMFFQGTLEEALKESVLLPAKNRKLLAVYLHHDNSVLSNVFCSQALCQLSVVDFLSANFIVWGWDLTHEANKARLLNLVTTHFGSVASSTVRSFSTDKLPALLLITRTRGTIEVLSVIHGNGVLDEVMTSLLHAMEMFEEQRWTEVQEEEARDAREAVKAEQDAAYQASLEADRAKAAAKKQAEEEERQERERAESLRQQEEAIKEAVRASLESEIPEEPSANCTDPVTTLRFRVPGGEIFTRTFLGETKLQVLLNFLHVRGYPADEYKCLQSWPRRDITSLDTAKNLMEHKLFPQETLNLEER